MDDTAFVNLDIESSLPSSSFRAPATHLVTPVTNSSFSDTLNFDPVKIDDGYTDFNLDAEEPPLIHRCCCLRFVSYSTLILRYSDGESSKKCILYEIISGFQIYGIYILVRLFLLSIKYFQ
eukprot:711201_1